MTTNNSGKKFLVIGATGMMGGLVARGLLDRGENVRALARDAEKAQPLKVLGAEIAIADLDDPSNLTPAFDGIDSVLLVTGNVKNPAQLGWLRSTLRRRLVCLTLFGTPWLTAAQTPLCFW
jgi:uncharacterized protein YbjT (DUF2867 family)